MEERRKIKEEKLKEDGARRKERECCMSNSSSRDGGKVKRGTRKQDKTSQDSYSKASSTKNDNSALPPHY